MNSSPTIIASWTSHCGQHRRRPPQFPCFQHAARSDASTHQMPLVSFHVENAGIRNMLQDIAIEEFSHLEMVGKLIAQHTSKIDQTAVYNAPLFKLKGGGPHFLDSQGVCWTA